MPRRRRSEPRRRGSRCGARTGSGPGPQAQQHQPLRFRQSTQRPLGDRLPPGSAHAHPTADSRRH
eukprot:4241732-Alexandrium_andersonii.AAC.1